MAELARCIEALCAGQRSYKICKPQSTSMQEAFKHVPIVHDTTLLLAVIHFGISWFAAYQLAKEFRRAEFYAFALTVSSKSNIRKTIAAHPHCMHAELQDTGIQRLLQARVMIILELKSL